MSDLRRGDRVLLRSFSEAGRATVIALDPDSPGSVLVDLDDAPVVAGLKFGLARWPVAEVILVERGLLGFSA